MEGGDSVATLGVISGVSDDHLRVAVTERGLVLLCFKLSALHCTARRRWWCGATTPLERRAEEISNKTIL